MGRVSSRTVQFKDGKKPWVFMLPDKEQWTLVRTGDTFEMLSNSVFKVKAKAPVDYCCLYL